MNGCLSLLARRGLAVKSFRISNLFYSERVGHLIHNLWQGSTGG